MAEISKIDGFDVGIDSQSPQFFKNDSSRLIGFDLGLESKSPQFFNDDSTIKMMGVGVETFGDSFSITINNVFR